jgi:hypothetical protein
MSGIFISYRREDAADEAHRLYRQLSAQFGAESVFIDVEKIDLGQDFTEVIDEKVGFCDSLVAVIGNRWLTCTDAEGRRRLDNPEDWVRLEIAAALSRDMKVFPVLVEGAPPPSSHDLPSPLAALARWQALPIHIDSFDADVSRLSESLALTRKEESIAALWFSIITRGHRALDPLDLHKPEALWRALGFLLLMSAIDTALHWPIMTDLWAPIKYVAGDCIQYLGAGFVLHFTMKAVGGKAMLQKSIATMCFLTAFVPLIALAQVPVWGLNTSIVRQVAANAVSFDQIVREMKVFLDAMGIFAAARLILAAMAATYLWWRFFGAAFSAFRTLHRLSKRVALWGFAFGMTILLPFVLFIVTPLFGAGHN